jgi:hypothetical protein
VEHKCPNGGVCRSRLYRQLGLFGLVIDGVDD